mgnify:CR=1 FL=1
MATKTATNTPKPMVLATIDDLAKSYPVSKSLLKTKDGKTMSLGDVFASAKSATGQGDVLHFARMLHSDPKASPGRPQKGKPHQNPILWGRVRDAMGIPKPAKKIAANPSGPNVNSAARKLIEGAFDQYNSLNDESKALYGFKDLVLKLWGPEVYDCKPKTAARGAGVISEKLKRVEAENARLLKIMEEKGIDAQQVPF